MSKSWELGDLELVVLWEQHQDDHLPHPLSFTTEIALHDDYVRAKRELARKLADTADPELLTAMTRITQPDVRMAVHARHGRDVTDPAGCLRMYAVRTGSNGFLIEQRIGKTIQHSAGFRITECSALGLADAVVAALPDCIPGCAGAVTLVERNPEADAGLDYSYGRSRVEDPGAGSDIVQTQRFLQQALIRFGWVEIIQGRSRFGPRGITRHALHWRDLTDDGRYLVDLRPNPTAVPVDSRQFTAHINTKIAAVLQSLRDEGG